MRVLRRRAELRRYRYSDLWANERVVMEVVMSMISAQTVKPVVPRLGGLQLSIRRCPELHFNDFSLNEFNVTL